MTSEKTYEQFIIEINKNAQTDGIQCDRGRFVEIYNKEQVAFQESVLENKNEEDIRYIQKFKVPNASLLKDSSEDDYEIFTLPEDYFDYITSVGIGSTNYCSGARITLNEFKEENREYILEDENNKPSFDYRDAPIFIGNDSIQAYKDNFTYEQLLLTYYRYPQPIRLVDPDDPESQFDETVQPEWDKKSNYRIISLCASRFLLNNNDQRFQADRQIAKQKK